LLLVCFYLVNLDSEMDTLLSMRVFRQVVESGSFVAAAERIDLSTAMTSKHVMNLERNLGVRLLNRTSKHMSLTEIGTIYYEQCQEILDRLEVVEAAVKRSAVATSGTLKVTAPVWFANPTFTKALATYHARYPNVLLDLNLNDRQVDLVEEGFDLALRVSSNPDTSLLSRRICPIKFRLVAAPDYLHNNGHPIAASELSQHEFLSYAYAPFGDRFFFDGSHDRQKIAATAMRSNSTSMLHQAAIAGMGLVVLPEWLIEDDLTSGRLELLQLDYAFCTYLDAVYTSRRYLSPKVRTFVDFLADYLV
jgi:DNA-binding transcriptional LysR family regulator